MTILKHELSQGKQTLFLWTAVIAFMLGVCIFIYPEMKDQMHEIGGMFANMGSFSAAFGMDQLNFGEFMGFFSVECGNIIGLGGALFAALIGISSLAKEEKEQTSEFLLTHPLCRSSAVAQKFAAVLTQIFALNAIVAAVTALSVQIIGETPDTKILALLFLAYLMLQIETAAVCFCISSFLSNGGSGIGLGMASLFYFLNLIANLSDKLRFLKYLTPFGYTEGSDIVTHGRIEPTYLSVGIAVTALSVIAAFWRYQKKDIA